MSRRVPLRNQILSRCCCGRCWHVPWTHLDRSSAGPRPQRKDRSTASSACGGDDDDDDDDMPFRRSMWLQWKQDLCVGWNVEALFVRHITFASDADRDGNGCWQLLESHVEMRRILWKDINSSSCPNVSFHPWISFFLRLILHFIKITRK